MSSTASTDGFAPHFADCEHGTTSDADAPPPAASPAGFTQGSDTERAAEEREAAFHDGQIAVQRRLPTPERIRERTSRLYEEVHELIDRQQTRSDRQKDIARRSSSRGSIVAASFAAAGRRRGSSVTAGGARSINKGDNAPTQLPNLYKTFEESRRRHLEEARNAKPFYPPDLQPSEFSEKNPATFSLRFQSGRFDSSSNDRSGRCPD